MSSDRWESIVNNTPAIFEINENANADGGEPLHEIDFFDEVDDNEQLYEDAGREFGVDPDLLKTFAYLETTHGRHDRLNPWNKSYRPMNIKYDYWEPLGRELNLTREEVEQSLDMENCVSLAQFVDRIAYHFDLPASKMQEFLEEQDVQKRANTIHSLIEIKTQLIKISKEIQEGGIDFSMN